MTADDAAPVLAALAIRPGMGPTGRASDTSRHGLRPLARRLLGELDIWWHAELVPPFLKDVLRLSRGRSGAPGSAGQSARRSVAWVRIDTASGGCNGAQGRYGKTLRQQMGHLPDAIRQEIVEGRRRLILDWSHEGRPVEGEPFGLILRQLERCGIPPCSVAVLTQNFSAELDPLRFHHGRTIGLTAILAHHHLAMMWSALPSDAAPAGRSLPVGFALDGGNRRSRHYVCLNWHLRPSRALLVARLRRQSVPGYVSFSALRRRPTNAAFERELAGLSTAETWAENRALVSELLASDPVFDVDPDLGPDGNEVYSLPHTWLRDATCFIVTETEMSGGGLRRFTEKTLKALVAGLPFVVFGNPGTVGELRAIGFDVHDGLIDHRYDLIEDPAERFEAGWAEVMRWLGRSPGFTNSELIDLRHAADHNRSIFQDDMAERWIAQPIRTLLDWSSAG